MKKNNRFILTSIFILFLNIPLFCLGQKFNVDDLSNESQANYFLANIKSVEYLSQQLFEGGFYINAFIIDDSKATPTEFFEETDQILSSILISITPDGDYYTESKLYKIGNFECPRILFLREGLFPEVVLAVEHGDAENRRKELFRLSGS